MLNHILHLLQQHGFLVEEFRYWTDLPAVQTFNHLKTFGISWNTKSTKTQDCWATRILYQTSRGTTFLCPAAGLLGSQMFSDVSDYQTQSELLFFNWYVFLCSTVNKWHVHRICFRWHFTQLPIFWEMKLQIERWWVLWLTVLLWLLELYSLVVAILMQHSEPVS